MLRRLATLLAVAQIACTVAARSVRDPPLLPDGPPSDPDEWSEPGSPEGWGAGVRRSPGRSALIVSRASSLVGLRSLSAVSRRVPDDCTGLVRLVYERAGADLVRGGGTRGENGVTAIYRHAEWSGAVHRDKPRPGDLVFFGETYDRNRDGRRNDGLTHVGVVESVDSRGTVIFIHRGSAGVARSRFNLRQPARRRGEDGAVLNDYLRPRSPHARAYLAGELFAGYASAEQLR